MKRKDSVHYCVLPYSVACWFHAWGLKHMALNVRSSDENLETLLIAGDEGSQR